MSYTLCLRSTKLGAKTRPTATSKNFSRKYFAMHVGDRNKGRGKNKQVYTSWWRALLILVKIKLKFNDELQIYRCYWTDEREWLEDAKHWHLGHSRYNVPGF